MHRTLRRPVLEPKGVSAVYRSSNSPTEKAIHLDGHIFGWLGAIWVLLARSELDALTQAQIRVSTYLIWVLWQLTRNLFFLWFRILFFWSWCWTLVSFTTHLDTEWTRWDSAWSCSAFTHQFILRLFLWLLGLVVSTILAVPLGHLHMRDFQCWVATLKLQSMCHGAWKVMVMAELIFMLYPRHRLTFLVQGVPLGPVMS